MMGILALLDRILAQQTSFGTPTYNPPLSQLEERPETVDIDLYRLMKTEVIVHSADSNYEQKLNPDSMYIYTGITHSNNTRQSQGFLRYYPEGQVDYYEGVLTQAPGTNFPGDLLTGFPRPFVVIGGGSLTYTGYNWQAGDVLTFRTMHIELPLSVATGEEIIETKQRRTRGGKKP